MQNRGRQICVLTVAGCKKANAQSLQSQHCQGTGRHGNSDHAHCAPGATGGGQLATREHGAAAVVELGQGACLATASCCGRAAAPLALRADGTGLLERGGGLGGTVGADHTTVCNHDIKRGLAAAAAARFDRLYHVVAADHLHRGRPRPRARQGSAYLIQPGRPGPAPAMVHRTPGRVAANPPAPTRFMHCMECQRHPETFFFGCRNGPAAGRTCPKTT